jgi:hypothetical protein
MRSSFFVKTILAVLAFGALGVLPAQATSFYERPFPDTVQDAPVIVRGKTGASHADWAVGPDGSKRIYTYYELRIDEVVKGTPASPRNINIREMGGEKDGLGMQVAGVSHYDPGEDVVVFLGEKNDDASHDVMGMMMGKYNVERDPKDGKEYIVGAGIPAATHPGLRGHEGIIHPGEEGQGDTRPDSKWTLEALRTLVREQAQKAAPAPSPSIPAKSPAVNADPLRRQTPAASPSVQAPQLQPSPSEEATSFLPWIGLALGGLGLVAFLVVLSRKSG